MQWAKNNNRAIWKINIILDSELSVGYIGFIVICGFFLNVYFVSAETNIE
jgi:hypothetical protein